ncbi:flagellar hook protein FlgE [Acidovorax sp. SRB_24]|uniref:flagellar hook protein FlgE n=1 Tax=Acidovorax sp. SRB_24 TaxID=1962700 RepID=UPI00145C7B1B|nr:flagellar hook protein FlgE [Acidovorax sp. SRB_24]NMM76302.1 flagellar biosynthesis protein FlgE [Acidovorax sp. SRB_24]NMM76394.1 flagellar biosynthesis protein FlgE [Acidovorax sp. SRB_24]
MSFEIALSGINAINTSLDTISNNIANSGTYGFKSSRANFSSMYAGSQPSGVRIGSQTQSIDIGGGVLTTGRGLDATIQGRGFFVTKDSTGVELYTRVGIFATDKDGYLVDSFNRKVQGYNAVVDAAGVPMPGAALGAMGDIKVPTGQIAAQASTRLEYVGNLSADWTAPTVTPFDPTNPLSYNSSSVAVAYDSLGAKHTVTQYFVKTGTNEVTVNYAIDGVTAGTPTVMEFEPTGQLKQPLPTAHLTLVTPTTGAEDMEIDINYAGSTQFAGETTNTVNATNGYASGALVGVQLSEDGSVVAQYSNGQKQKVGTVALATFPNENALVSVNDTSWTTSSGSGTPLYGTPGSGMTGALTVGAIEQSNVDMTSELVSLMTSQRNYQANTKVISAESDMMKTLMQAV